MSHNLKVLNLVCRSRAFSFQRRRTRSRIKTFQCLAKALLALQAPEKCSSGADADSRCRHLCWVEIIAWDNRKRDNTLRDEALRRAGLEPGRPDERTALCTGHGHVRLQPHYMATNELPIRRIYCLVLSQELIKSTQLKAAVRETWAASGLPFG